MGLGSTEPQRKVYFMSPRAQDKDKNLYPHFKVQVREQNGIKDHPDEFAVSGYLIQIGTGGYDYKGDFKRTIKLYLVDGEDMFKIEANVQSNMIRSLMNTVIGTKDFDVMRIALYAKNENPGIFITNNGEKTKWAFDYKEDLEPLIQEVPDPQRPGKTVKVYHQVDEMLWKAWIELEPYIAKRAKELGYDKIGLEESKSESITTKPADQSTQEGFNQNGGPGVDDFEPITSTDDDLPF